MSVEGNNILVRFSESLSHLIKCSLILWHSILLEVALEDRSSPSKWNLFIHWPSRTIWHPFWEFLNEWMRLWEVKYSFITQGWMDERMEHEYKKVEPSLLWITWLVRRVKSEVREAVNLIRTILLEETKGGKCLIRVEIRGDVFT